MCCFLVRESKDLRIACYISILLQLVFFAMGSAQPSKSERGNDSDILIPITHRTITLRCYIASDKDRLLYQMLLTILFRISCVSHIIICLILSNMSMINISILIRYTINSRPICKRYSFISALFNEIFVVYIRYLNLGYYFCFIDINV